MEEIDFEFSHANPFREIDVPFREFEHYPYPIIGGGGSKQIQGKLKALETRNSGPFTGLNVGQIEVEVAPCSESSLIGQTIEVVDWSKCIFDLPFDDLEDVWVWANEGIGLSQEAGAQAGELTPCHYTADDRCCVAADEA